MSKFFSLLTLITFTASALAAAPAGFQNDLVQIGNPKSAATDKKLVFSNGSANPPFVKLNATTGRLQYANDGLNPVDIGSGGGSGQGVNLFTLNNGNGDFETGGTGWTASGGAGHLTLATSGANLYDGKNTGIFTPTAGSETLASGQFSTNGLTNNNCLTKVTALTAESAHPYTLQVVDGSGNILGQTTIPNTTFFQDVPVSFPCPSVATTTIGIKITTPSSAPTSPLYLDDAYVGSNFAVLAVSSPVTTTVQTFLTAGTFTYTLPTNPSPFYIRVRLVGGGGGGSGSGTATGTAAGDGGTTSFGTSFLTANGGTKGVFSSGSGTPGTATIGAGANGIAITGGKGGGVSFAVIDVAGGYGGATPLGGAGGSSQGGGGGNAAPNSGAGGGGGGTGSAANAYSGSGGFAGGFIDAIVSNPASSYTVIVGSGGAAGGLGTSGFTGGAGGSGMVEVTEYYSPIKSQAYYMSSGGLSAGDMLFTANTACPVGTIPADGTTYNTGTYPALEQGIWTGSAWLYGGTGTISSGTWNAPNLKGIFPRGAGSQVIGGITYSSTQGTTQGDQIQGHWHAINDPGHTHNITSVSSSGPGAGGNLAASGNTANSSTPTNNATTGLTVRAPSTDGTNGTPRVGAETRPANLGLLACVRTIPASAAPVIIGSSNSYITATAKTANYTLLPNDSTITFDATSGNLTATLPSAAGIQGQIYRIKKVDSSTNTVAIATTASQLVDGYSSSTWLLTAKGDYMNVQSDGANWQVIDSQVTDEVVLSGYATNYGATCTTVNFTTTEIDPYGQNSAGVITVKLAGKYQLSWQAANQGAASGLMEVHLYKNGSGGTALGYSTNVLTSNFGSAGAARAVKLVVGDTISMCVNTSSSSPPYGPGTHLSLVRVGN